MTRIPYTLFIFIPIWCYFPGDHSFVFQSVHQRQPGNEQVSWSSYSGLCSCGRYITLIFDICLFSNFKDLSLIPVRPTIKAFGRWVKRRIEEMSSRIKSGNWHCRKLWSNVLVTRHKKMAFNKPGQYRIDRLIIWVNSCSSVPLFQTFL